MKFTKTIAAIALFAAAASAGASGLQGSPTRLEGVPGQTVELTLTNTGSTDLTEMTVAFNGYIKGAEIGGFELQALKPGEARVVTVKLPKASQTARLGVSFSDAAGGAGLGFEVPVIVK